MVGLIENIMGGFSFGDPIGIAINLILSTIVMGIVIIILSKVVARDSDEDIMPSHAFGLALLINIINIALLLDFVKNLLLFIPLYGIIVPLFVWIIATKLFFSHMHIVHAVIIGVVGFILSILAMPPLVALLLSLIPL